MNKYFKYIFQIIFVLLMMSCNKKELSDPKIHYFKISEDTVYPNSNVKISAIDTSFKGKLYYEYKSLTGKLIFSFRDKDKLEYDDYVIWQVPAKKGVDSILVVISNKDLKSDSLYAKIVILDSTTQISGTIELPEYLTGNLYLTKISLYKDYQNWERNTPKYLFVSGDEGRRIVYNLIGIEPGKYILDFLKDHDDNDKWSYGDYVGWYGSGTLDSPILDYIEINENETVYFDINEMFIVKNTKNRTAN